MNNSYFPNYYSVEDIFVTQEKVECKVNTKLTKMGFLDAGAETDDLNPGSTVSLPLWYIKELKINNPYFTVNVPDIYKNVHKAVCEADTTHIELGKLHPYFYEYGRYLTPYDRSHNVGRIVFETMRQRVRYLLDISTNTTEDGKPEHRLDDIENKLYEAGVNTNTQFTKWLQMKSNKIPISEMVHEYNKKRKRELVTENDSNAENPSKRSTL
ncbi:probable DNA replication complex GINS protein PSF3 [Teleopsis dalmanni]|uniref:probable DNA replication complex GINS protein PSF3 n=1 Tax=Teleopsis dalmanni TaxID=139649 RepID=UPI0018CCECA2|nr:probable DNA replication complex GINS protein PSF3 [Teleopsis dalmanni]